MDLSTEIEDAIQSLQDTFLAKYRHEMIQAWPGRVATTGEPRGMNQHAGLYSAFLCDGRDGGSDGIVVKRLEAFQRRTQPREALTVLGGELTGGGLRFVLHVFLEIKPGVNRQ